MAQAALPSSAFGEADLGFDVHYAGKIRATPARPCVDSSARNVEIKMRSIRFGGLSMIEHELRPLRLAAPPQYRDPRCRVVFIRAMRGASVCVELNPHYLDTTTTLTGLFLAGGQLETLTLPLI